MLQKNYLILAHKNFPQIRRLVKALDDGSSNFIIHLDLESDLQGLKNILEQKETLFCVEDRISCIWGDFSIVEATINGIDFIIKNKFSGYTILMSGQDYPIKSQKYIRAYLEENQNYNHISVHRNPVAETEEVFYKRRLTNYNFFLSKKRGDAVSIPYFWTQSLKEKVKTLLFITKNYGKGNFLKIFRKKKFPFKDFYQGHQWFAFNQETLQKVHQYINENQGELISFFKYVTVPDEFFFHTVLKNLQKNDKDILIKNSLTVNLPYNFDESHFDQLKNELPHKLFARKFDEEFNTKIFDLLDESFLEETHKI